MAPADREPPSRIWLDLDEALELLAAIEDACEALGDSGYLAAVVELEAQVRTLSRRLGFDDPRGGDHDL